MCCALQKKRKKSLLSQGAEMPNEGYEHEMAPEEENRARFARPRMREQIVDLLARCNTLKHTLIIPPCVSFSYTLTNTSSMGTCAEQM